MKKTHIAIIILIFLLTYSCDGILVMPDFTADRPVISPPGGAFDGSVDITIRTGTELSTIYYTTDASMPTGSSASVDSAAGIDLTIENGFVKAYTGKFGYFDSAVSSGFYYTYLDTITFGAGDDEIVSDIAARPGTEQTYITGQFRGLTDLDPGDGADAKSSVGNYDLFVSKLDSSSNYLWGFALGSTEIDTSRGIAVDNSGNVFITGQLYKDAGVGQEIFISKLSNTGVWGWTKFSGGAQDDGGTSVVINNNGALYYCGTFSATADLDPRENDELYITASGQSDFSITRLDDIDTVGTFTWSLAAGGDGIEEITSLAHDNSNNLLAGGFFTGITNLDPSGDSGNHTSTGREDAFIATYDEDGNYLTSFTFGGSGDDRITALTVDPGGLLYVCGTFNGTVDFDPGSSVVSASGNNDVFIACYTSLGELQWLHSLAGDGIATANDLEAGGDIIYVTGTFSGTIKSESGSSQSYRTAGGTDIFTLTLGTDGSFGSINTRGNIYDDTGSSIIITPSGDVKEAGSFIKSMDADPGPGSDQVISAGMSDSFLTTYRY
jgi:hypothetical protein